MSGGEPARANRQMTPEERARLVAALDHDVRQPQHSIEMGLRTLKLLTAELRARRFNEESLDTVLQRFTLELTSLQAAHRQVVDLQNDLLDAMRLEVDEPTPRSRVISADDLIDRICRSNRVHADEIELRGGRTRLTFYSDERWVERILNNLVTNAIRHSHATKVLLGARARNDEIVFEIRDNGDGIAADKLSEVLRPPRSDGLSNMNLLRARRGLGLYNVKVLAERLGGRVQCMSLPRKGSLFRVSFPGPLGLSEPRQRAQVSAAAIAVRNKVVTILDDDPVVLRSTERLLSQLGVEVYADNDPLRWLCVVTDMGRPPDLIILDFQLGGHDCSLQLEIVRRKWGTSQLKVLVLTGASPTPALLRVANEAPILKKPLTEEKIELIVNALAGRRELPSRGFVEMNFDEQQNKPPTTA